MIVSTIDVISSAEAYVFGVGNVPLDKISAQAFKFGNVSIVDIQAAKKEGCNKDTVLRLASTAGITARVSGGFSPKEGDIISWYRSPTKENLVAIDCMLDGRVTCRGQQEIADVTAQELFEKFKDYHIFLTLVDGQGKKIPFDVYQDWIKKVQCRKITVAGGVSTPDDAAKLHHMGIDCHVGAAIYREDITLWSYLDSVLKPVDLFPMCVQDVKGNVLGILHTNRETLKMTCDAMRLVAYSRSRKKIWIKDQTKSGVDVISIRHNCNCDSLLVVVGDGKHDWCHVGSGSCFTI